MGGMNARDTPLGFLLTRRSVPAKTLIGPAPSKVAIRQMLTAAARVPDHGKLEPSRFAVPGPGAARRLAALARALGTARGIDPDTQAKLIAGFAQSPTIVTVLSTPVASEKIPLHEQQLSAGAVCLGLVNAALAMGYGANWLSGWIAHDAEFVARAFGLHPPARIAGFIHIGTIRTRPPERPRPDIDAITTWVEE